MQNKLINKYIGNGRFYRRVLALTMPIMIQNGITNFVSMLDNVMVGRVGTIPMTGVAISNQLILVYSLCVFGAVSGAGIFGAQLYGKGDTSGVRYTFRFKLIFCTLLSLLCIFVFIFFGDTLISLYLHGEGDPEAAAASLEYAKQYLIIMLIGLIPYGIVQCYSSTLRECGQSFLPMCAGVAAVCVNLFLNYILIFGNFGAPALGVNGAAIATVISRFVELIIIMVWTFVHRERNAFIKGAFKSLYVPGALMRNITIKGMPLMLNEALWAAGTAAVNQCYSVRGLDVVAANNISQTFFSVFSVVFMSVGVSIGIILGQQLGANKKDEARDTCRKLMVFSVFVSLIIGVIYFVSARYIPHVYNTSDSVRHMAMRLMQICAVFMPFDAFVNASYFTLRSGGKMLTTILFDCCFVMFVNFPVAFVLTHYTSLPLLTLFAICHGLCLIKCIIGYCLVKRGIWLHNITEK